MEAGDKKGRSKGKVASDEKAEALEKQLTALRSKIDEAREEASKVAAVSYTHLTLPTIYSV